VKKILVTGCAGFIGMHLCKELLKNKFLIFGVDNLNDYYDTNLKMDRLEKLKTFDNFSFAKVDITNKSDLNEVFSEFKPDKVVNLAAQAGVRYSLVDPHAYVKTNIYGFLNILEASKNNNIEGLVYASSSSVYGANEKIPFSIYDRVDAPISLYAASKRSNELMAYTYNHLYKLNVIGLRFFTVYGPWGRPDMAIYLFAKKIMAGQKISVYNHGNMLRDFTYIDDVVSGIISSLKKNYSNRIFNIGNNKPENLLDVIKLIEDKLNKRAKINFLEIQPGDVEKTFADIASAQEELNYVPKTTVIKGIPKFINWFKNYHNFKN